MTSPPSFPFPFFPPFLFFFLPFPTPIPSPPFPSSYPLNPARGSGSAESYSSGSGGDRQTIFGVFWGWNYALFVTCIMTHLYFYLAPGGGDGVLFSREDFFLCFNVSKITRKRLDRFAWNFQGRCGVTMGRPDYILCQFRLTGRQVIGQFVCYHQP